MIGMVAEKVEEFGVGVMVGKLAVLRVLKVVLDEREAAERGRMGEKEREVGEDVFGGVEPGERWEASEDGGEV